jgi:hypothetical protein
MGERAYLICVYGCTYRHYTVVWHQHWRKSLHYVVRDHQLNLLMKLHYLRLKEKDRKDREQKSVQSPLSPIGADYIVLSQCVSARCLCVRVARLFYSESYHVMSAALVQKSKELAHGFGSNYKNQIFINKKCEREKLKNTYPPALCFFSSTSTSS